MKNLILGAYSNIKNINNIKNWILSAKEIDNCDICLMVYDEDIDHIKDHPILKDVNIIQIKSTPYNISTKSILYDTGLSNPNNSHNLVHHIRFYHFWKLLKSNLEEYTNVIITDVRDVIFNPTLSIFLENIGKLDNIHVADECIKIKDEDWNKHNIIKNFGEQLYDEIKDYNVLCCGVMMGSIKDMKDLCLLIYEISSGKWLADQSGLNIIKYLNDYYNTKIIPNRSILQVHSRMLPHIKTKSSHPVNMNDNIRNQFNIIHQYERLPELLEKIEKDYKI